jgi:hypothetical protein
MNTENKKKAKKKAWVNLWLAQLHPSLTKALLSYIVVSTEG